jgi:hypothetical protein
VHRALRQFAEQPAQSVSQQYLTYGEQTWDEMMSGWIEVAFDPAKEPKSLFDQARTAATE